SLISMVALAFESHNAARDAVEAIKQLEPCLLEYVDATLYEKGAERGKKYSFYPDALEKGDVEAVLLVGFDDSHDHKRFKKQKKLLKIMEPQTVHTAMSVGAAEADELLALRDVSHVAVQP